MSNERKHKEVPMVSKLFLATLVLAVAIASPVLAATCALDDAPGATLLLPYFEVDPAHASGPTTLFSINNAGPAATLAHVVLWTDIGIPTLSFDVYLTGYDVQTINLRDVFNGVLPGTADAGRDPSDVISPRGDFSQDTAIASCAGVLPPAPVPASAQDALRRAHTGVGAAGNPSQCSGLFFGDGLARGYVTVDAARRCSALVPGVGGYFGPGGVASDSNVLWGDFFYVTPGAQQAAQGQNLVRLESDPAAFVAKPTFYSDLVGGNGVDGREPLPTTWAVRFLDGGSFVGTTDLVTWRDTRQIGATFNCAQKPLWYPLEQRRVVVFDEQENPDVPVFCPASGCPPFEVPISAAPAAANRVRIGGAQLPVPFTFGWLFLDLNTGSDPIPVRGPAWVGTIASAQGLFSVGLAGTPLDNGCAPYNGPLIPGSF